MGGNHYTPKLSKQRPVLANADYTVYSVNGLAVRNVAQPDEEFGNFATRDEFPDLIPEGEIWISEKLAAQGGRLLHRQRPDPAGRQAAGATRQGLRGRPGGRASCCARSSTASSSATASRTSRCPTRSTWSRTSRCPTRRGRCEVWLVDGNLVRSYYKTDYTEGGHGYVYPWVPRPEIWIEDGVDHREMPFIVSHEYLERRLMRDEGLDYDTAHEICSKVEFDLRKCEGATPLLVCGRRKLAKPDLPRLTGDEVFEYVLRTYVRKG